MSFCVSQGALIISLCYFASLAVCINFYIKKMIKSAAGPPQLVWQLERLERCAEQFVAEASGATTCKVENVSLTIFRSGDTFTEVQPESPPY